MRTIGGELAPLKVNANNYGAPGRQKYGKHSVALIVWTVVGAPPCCRESVEPLLTWRPSLPSYSRIRMSTSSSDCAVGIASVFPPALSELAESGPSS
jgi:hypothetical protein